MNPINLGQTILELRNRRNISSFDFVGKAGITLFRLQQIEDGVILPTDEELEDISRALNIPRYYIQLLSLDPKDINEDKIEVFNKLMPKIKELIEHFYFPEGSGQPETSQVQA